MSSSGVTIKRFRLQELLPGRSVPLAFGVEGRPARRF